MKEQSNAISPVSEVFPEDSMASGVTATERGCPFWDAMNYSSYYRSPLAGKRPAFRELVPLLPRLPPVNHWKWWRPVWRRWPRHRQPLLCSKLLPVQPPGWAEFRSEMNNSSLYHCVLAQPAEWRGSVSPAFTEHWAGAQGPRCPHKCSRSLPRAAVASCFIHSLTFLFPSSSSHWFL